MGKILIGFLVIVIISIFVIDVFDIIIFEPQELIIGYFMLFIVMISLVFVGRKTKDKI